MVTLVVFHNVQDYATWKLVFDEHEAVRRSHNELEHRVYQGLHDRNRVVVHNDFPGEEAARAFMADPSLATAMEKAGIIGEPWLGLNECVERKTYRDGVAAVTIAVHHRVRAYGAWKPVFDEHESVRRGHGELEHRIYRPLGDEHAVVIHNDFPSQEAAEAFAQDPSLPAAMERGGVEGELGIGFVTRSERKVYVDVAAV